MRIGGLALIAALMFATPAAASHHCVWFGDSIDAMVADGVANQASVALIQQERDVFVHNLSSAGASLARPVFGYNSTFSTDALNSVNGFFRSVDCIVIAVGTNDFGNQAQHWEEVAASLDRILVWARDNNVHVLMTDLIWRTPYEAGAPNGMGLTWVQFRAARAQVCASYAVCRYAARPPEFDSARPDLYTAGATNLVHPNAAGHRLRATWIEQAGDGWVW